jgi:ATP:ADP antiporter, AAA family
LIAPQSPNLASLESLLRRILHIEPGEVAGVVWSFAYFFSVLSAYYIIRPVRDEMGVAVGTIGLQRLFVIVFFVMLAAVPLFGWVVSTFPCRRIVPIVYGFFIINLIGFWSLFQTGIYRPTVAGTFFVWASVFNLFVVSLFWILLSDLYRTDQAKRLYGFIAAGGSAGALAGPLITQSLVTTLGANNLLLVSALFLASATLAAIVLRRLFVEIGEDQGEDLPIGQGLLAGAVAAWRSPYIFRIALWILLANLVETLFYLEQSRIVGETLADRNARVQLFARIDLAVSILTILAQVFLTGRVLERFGVGIAAAALPVSAAVGLVMLTISPTLGVIITIMVVQRTITFALANPAIKVLYTLVGQEEKYKAQNFNDTVVFRAGDAASGWLFNTLATGLGLGLATTAAVTVPITLAWFSLSLILGRQHQGRVATGW